MSEAKREVWVLEYDDGQPHRVSVGEREMRQREKWSKTQRVVRYVPEASAQGEAGRTWIACSERMPEPHADVLVWSGRIREYGIACLRDGVWHEDLSGLKLTDAGGLTVTHWMPLPPPPKAEP